MRGVRAAALAAVAMVLTACDGGAPTALACKVDVDTPDLVGDREAAGIADCTELPTEAGASDLPDISLHCLGSTESMSLADVKGPAIINFWSTTCGPCREEMPVLQQFHEEYGAAAGVAARRGHEPGQVGGLDLARRPLDRAQPVREVRGRDRAAHRLIPRCLRTRATRSSYESTPPYCW